MDVTESFAVVVCIVVLFEQKEQMFAHDTKILEIAE